MPLAKLILSEPFKPTRHLLVQVNPFLIGRSPDCALILDRTSISKHHAQILFDEEQFLLQDLESKNGTMVNGELIQERRLSDRDLITMGGVDLIFQRVHEQEWNADLESKLKKIKSAIGFSKSIGSNLVLDPILDEIIHTVMQLTQAERAFLMIEDEKGPMQMVRSVNITADELKSSRFHLSMTAVERAIETKAAVAVSNASDDSYFGDQSSVQELQLKTLVCVPLLTESDHVTGILYADSNRTEQEFAQLDVDLLESLAANAVIAIQNASLNRDILKLIGEVSNVLKQVEGSATLDQSLQTTVQQSLTSLSSLKRKRFSKTKGTLIVEDIN